MRSPAVGSAPTLALALAVALCLGRLGPAEAYPGPLLSGEANGGPVDLEAQPTVAALTDVVEPVSETDDLARNVAVPIQDPVDKPATRMPQVSDRESCRSPAALSGFLARSTEKLRRVRELMALKGVDAYIIPSSDEHGSEYTALPDHRRQWISGFTGSVGDVVVTKDKAALWTDSRYFIQAEAQLDCNWILMKIGEPETPSIPQWLASGVVGRGKFIGADPRLLSYVLWSTWDNYLASAHAPRLLPIEENLVDKAWGIDQPSYPNVTLEVLDVKYSGEPWQHKVTRVRDEMRKAGGELLVLSAMDDGAWLLNLRGAEVPYTPVFRVYVVIGMDKMWVYMPQEKTSQLVRNHLCDPEIKVEFRDHQDIWRDLPSFSASVNKVLLTSNTVYHTGSSFALYKAVPAGKVKFISSPVLYMKAIKNPAEAHGMRNAHVKDAVALVQMLAILEEEVPAGKYWDELAVVDALERLRWEQEDSRGPSFETISAFGTNSALPHYAPTNETNKQLTTHGLFMLDSGGQYLDGTTDVTRTVHWGRPTQQQVDVYTRLLKGCVDLASLRFPEGRTSTMQNLDVLIRAPLYKLGLVYGHGSTHGIGSHLGVHESFDYTYHENFFGSQEPGYYEKDNFGMRLENIVQVVPAVVKYASKMKFLTFETTTLVPYERKLINTTLLENDEVLWLNTYYERIRRLVGSELLKQKKVKAYRWLMEQTQPFIK